MPVKARCQYWDECKGESDEDKVHFCVDIKRKKTFWGCKWNFRRVSGGNIARYEVFMKDPLK